jgi:hypothetical protein
MTRGLRYPWRTDLIPNPDEEGHFPSVEKVANYQTRGRVIITIPSSLCPFVATFITANTNRSSGLKQVSPLKWQIKKNKSDPKSARNPVDILTVTIN